MRICHFNIVGVAWSNFKPGVTTNERISIFNYILPIDVVSVNCDVYVVLVKLGRWERGA
jgi:hypothetical protein